MTKRELYNAVITGNITEEVVEGFEALIEGLDHTNELRKVSAAKKAAEKEAADKAAADAASEKIDALPAADNVTTDSKDAIELWNRRVKE